MKLGINFKTWKGEVQCDAIVIGSGIGGLTAAVFLAKAGKKVLVLERHYTLGGFTHVFKRPGFEWDVGVHYIGDVNDPRSDAGKIFRYISGGQLKWQKMPDLYDQLIFPDRTLNLRAGRKNLRDELVSHFPKEAKGIDGYLDIVKKLPSEYSLKYHALKALPRFVANPLSLVMGRKFLQWASRTTEDVLDQFTQNPELKGVLAGQWGDYGLPPKQSSFAVHSMVANHFIHGGAYPVGGSAQFAQTIVPELERHGGMVMYHAEVQQITHQNGRVTGVEMADGRHFKAPLVLSSAGMEVTFGKLLDESPGWQQKYLNVAKEIGASVGHFCLYLGLDIPFSQLGVPGSNLWVYPGYDHDKQVAAFTDPEKSELPVAYISFPSGKDPEWETRFPGKSTIEIITLASWDWVKNWNDSRWMKRGADYDAMKNAITQRMLEALYRQVPAAKGHIVHQELSSPLSTKHFVGWQQGEIYGLNHTPKRFLANITPFTPMKGLYLTGQDVVTCGVAGAMFGGVLTAAAILRKNVMKDAFRAG